MQYSKEARRHNTDKHPVLSIAVYAGLAFGFMLSTASCDTGTGKGYYDCIQKGSGYKWNSSTQTCEATRAQINDHTQLVHMNVQSIRL